MFAILALPDWKNPESFMEFGKPRFAFLVNGGNMDSMVSNYTASKKPRTSDAYAPGNRAGMRPDRATIAYSNAIKKNLQESSGNYWRNRSIFKKNGPLRLLE